MKPILMCSFGTEESILSVLIDLISPLSTSNKKKQVVVFYSVFSPTKADR